MRALRSASAISDLHNVSSVSVFCYARYGCLKPQTYNHKLAQADCILSYVNLSLTRSFGF